MDTEHAITVQIAFAADETLRPELAHLLSMIDDLDRHGLASALDVPDAEEARVILRLGARTYHQMLEDAVGELREHSQIDGTSLLVCVASETFYSAEELDDEALHSAVADHWLGYLGTFLALLDQVPALGGPAGLVCTGMPGLDTVRAYAVRDEQLSSVVSQ